MKYLFLVIFMIAGCATPASGLPAMPAECSPLPGWQDVASAAEGRVLIFGELHGTAEAPRAFGEYVCAVASREGATIVGLEITDQYREGFETAIAALDIAYALEHEMPEYWAGQDGRSSEAMFDMIVRLAELRQSGLNIEFVLLAAVSAEIQQKYIATGDQTYIEKAYADGLATASGSAARTIVLVGSLHALKERRAEWMTFDPMAMHIEPAPLSLNLRYSGGFA